MVWLVTGGAGYIGAHVIRGLRAANEHVVVLDDLSTGLPGRVPPDVPFVRGNVGDHTALRDILSIYRVDGVIHLAARKSVTESQSDPLGYQRANMGALAALLDVMTEHKVRNLVFSSTAAVYGHTHRYREDAPTAPLTPYGRTKLAGEWLIQDVAAASTLRYANLRFFNVAGAGGHDLGDVRGTNLLPRLLGAAAEGRRATVYGLDHGTPDGSCIRDYVHPTDVAEAHVAAARALRAGGLAAATLNVGRGVGVSVLELIAAVERVTQLTLRYLVAGARAGDAPCTVANAELIAERLGWRARHDVDDIVRSAWAAWTTGPTIARQRTQPLAAEHLVELS